MIVYKCTCLPSGKSYIGITTLTLERRKQKHLRDAAARRFNMGLHAAIRKYGVAEFAWEVIDRALFVESLYVLEKYYIEKFNTLSPNGYNLTTGGLGGAGAKWSLEARNRARIRMTGAGNPNFGKRHTEESKKKMSEKQLLYSDAKRKRMCGPDNPGRHQSEETKRKRGLMFIGEKNPNYHKPMSEEQRRKVSEGLKRYFANKKKSELEEAIA